MSGLIHLRSLCILILVAATWIALVSYAHAGVLDKSSNESDYIVTRVDFEVRVIPETWSVSVHATYSLAPLAKGSNTLVLVAPPINYAYNVLQISGSSPCATIRKEQRRNETLWYFDFGDTMDSSVPFDVSVDYTIRTLADALERTNIRAGVTPLGVYNLSYQLVPVGSSTGAKEYTVHLKLPTGWMAVPCDMGSPVLYAGPYRDCLWDVDGVQVTLYALTEADLRFAKRTISVCVQSLVTRLGLPPATKQTVVQVPRYHGSGFSDGSFTAFCLRTTPSEDNCLSNTELIYHEIAHKWVVFDTLKGWPLAQESFCEYLVFIVLERVQGPNRAREFMGRHRSNYFHFAAQGDAPPLSSQPRSPSERGATHYSKGVWLWHTLRFLLRDDAFFELIMDLREDYCNGNAITTVGELADRIAVYRASFGPFLLDAVGQSGTARVNASVSNRGLGIDPQMDDSEQLVLLTSSGVQVPEVEIEIYSADKIDRRRVRLRGPLTRVPAGAFPVEDIVVDPSSWILMPEPYHSNFQLFPVFGLMLAIVIFFFGYTILREVLSYLDASLFQRPDQVSAPSKTID